MNSEQSILVTGGTGFLGSYILKKLISLGYKNIKAIHRKTSSFEMVQDIIDEIDWVECDLLDEYRLDEVVIEVDYVIHAAAMISFWPREYDQMFSVNVMGTQKLVDMCLRHDVKNLIYISSVEAIGKEENGALITESTEWKDEYALSQYGISKHHAELEVWRGKEEGLNVTVYNPGLIVGAANWTNAPMSIFKDIYKGFNYYPKGAIGVVDVRDVSDIVCRNLDNGKLTGEQYILIGENISYKDFFNAISKGLNITKPAKKLSPLIARLSIWFEGLRGYLTKNPPLITQETYRIASMQLNYSSDKIKDQTSFEFRKVKESISEIGACFLNSYPVGINFATFKNT